MSYYLNMKITKPYYEFSEEKNQLLINERGVSFEDIIAALDSGQLLGTIEHPNGDKYPNQKIYLVNLNDYVYLVPFVYKDEQTVFLKTLFPSRKLTKIYRHKENKDE